MRELEDFLQVWGGESPEVKEVFLRLRAFAQALPGVSLSYVGRPGISHSLRFHGAENPERPFFAMIDVIDDEPDARWLSICMYADLAADPEGRGDLIPGGLGGQDALCFDVYGEEEDAAEYLEEVLRQAASKAV